MFKKDYRTLCNRKLDGTEVTVLIRESVVGVKSKYDKMGEIPTAIVVLKDKSMDKEKARNQILEYQGHLLGERDGAIDIRFRESLPLTPVGKIDSVRLTEEENESLSDVDFAGLTNSSF